MSFIQIIDDDESIGVPFGDSAIYVRRMPARKLVEIRRQFIKDYNQNGQEMDELDSLELNEVILGWGIRDWKEVKNSKTGEEVPYQPEMISKLHAKIQVALLAVIAEREDELAEEASEKN